MALGHLGGLGARSSAEIDHDVDVVHRQHLHGEHRRGLLARDAAGLMQMGQQGPRLAFGVTSREGHGEGLMEADPRHPFAADGLDLVDRPRRILAVGRDAKGLRERVFDHAQPCIEVGPEGGGETSKRRGGQIFTRGRLPPDHRNRFRLRAFGFKPSLLAAD